MNERLVSAKLIANNWAFNDVTRQRLAEDIGKLVDGAYRDGWRAGAEAMRAAAENVADEFSPDINESWENADSLILKGIHDLVRPEPPEPESVKP